MREFNFDLFPETPLGLRRDARDVHRSQYLTTAKNVRGSQFQIEDYEPIVDPFLGAVVPAFPNPQLIRGMGLTLLADATSLASVDESGSPWTTAAIQTYDPDDPYSTKVITSGGEWHFADALTAYYMFNGACTIFRVNAEQLAGLPQKVFVQDSVTITTGCSHKGRIIFGGFDSSNFWGDYWQGIFEQFKSDLEDQGVELLYNDIDKNWVFWSSIGGGDFPLWLFFPTLYASELVAPTLSGFVDRLKRNELGWMPMPFQGQVLNIKPLGDNVIVYGEDGICALVPSEGRVGTEAPSTFGKRNILPIGVAQRDAVGVSKEYHIFLDQAGDLWRLTPDLVPERLGYREYLYDMIGENIRISYDEQQKDFRICSDNHGFLFNQTGLYSHYQRVTSSVFAAGGVVGLSDDDVDTEAMIVSSSFDMSHMGLKKVASVSVDVRSTANIFVALDYRYNRNEAWRRSKWVIVNLEGNARMDVVGLEFRLAIKCATLTDFEIDSARIRWQKDDIRAVRGPDADPSVTGAS